MSQRQSAITDRTLAWTVHSSPVHCTFSVVQARDSLHPHNEAKNKESKCEVAVSQSWPVGEEER